MILIYILLFVVALFGLRIFFRGFVGDAMCRTQTEAVKGVFIVLVFCRHFASYFHTTGYDGSSFYDRMFTLIDSRLAQLIVVMFLFYSGFGVASAIARKGQLYVESFPRHRILETLLNFDVAVVIFGLLGLVLGTQFTLKQLTLSLIGLESLGNSAWYIFAIIVFYFFAWIVAHIKYIFARNVVLFTLTVGYVLIMGRYKASFWFDTALAFPLGFLYSDYREKIEAILKRNFWITLMGFVVLFYVIEHLPLYAHGMVPNARACVFSLIIVMLTFKIELKSSVLRWCGKNLFPLYIYQRLPMIVLATVGGDGCSGNTSSLRFLSPPR